MLLRGQRATASCAATEDNTGNNSLSR